MHLRPLAALSATALTAGLLVTAAPSYAENVSTIDSTHDAQKTDEGTVEDLEPAPREKATDITKFTTEYGNGRVKLTTQVRELPSHLNNGSFIAYWRVKTQDIDGLITYPSQRARQLSAGARLQGCSPSYDVSKRNDTVSVRFARSCLGDNPSWVRTGAAVIREGSNFVFADDARRDGAFSNNLKLSPNEIHHN